MLESKGLQIPKKPGVFYSFLLPPHLYGSKVSTANVWVTTCFYFLCLLIGKYYVMHVQGPHGVVTQETYSELENGRMTRLHEMLLESSVQVFISFVLCSDPARSTPPLIIVSSTVLWLDITEVVDFQTLLACFSCTSNSVSLWCLSTVPFAFMQPKRTVLSTQFKMRPKIPCLPSSPTSHVSSYFTRTGEIRCWYC